MEYNWNIVNLDRKTADGFVITAHYTVSATDGEFTASTYGTVGYTQEDKSYTPFASLTKEQVIGWVKESLGQATVEEALAAQIEAEKNPVQESGLPWVTLEAPI
jgi:hypothetical protein